MPCLQSFTVYSGNFAGKKFAKLLAIHNEDSFLFFKNIFVMAFLPVWSRHLDHLPKRFCAEQSRVLSFSRCFLFP